MPEAALVPVALPVPPILAALTTNAALRRLPELTPVALPLPLVETKSPSKLPLLSVVDPATAPELFADALPPAWVVLRRAPVTPPALIRFASPPSALKVANPPFTIPVPVFVAVNAPPALGLASAKAGALPLLTQVSSMPAKVQANCARAGAATNTDAATSIAAAAARNRSVRLAISRILGAIVRWSSVFSNIFGSKLRAHER